MKKLLTVLFSLILLSVAYGQPDPDIAGYNIYIDKLDNNRYFSGQSFIWSDTTLVFAWEDGDSIAPGFISEYNQTPVIGSPIYFVNDSSLWIGGSANASVDLTFDRGVYEFTVTAVDVAGGESGHSDPLYIRFIRRARVPINIRFER